MNKFLLLAVFFISSVVHAQHSEQPVKENDTDLRNQSILFAIESKDNKTTYFLERTVGRDYFLRRKTTKNDELKKLASHFAQQLDREFSSLFLKVQYEIPDVDGKCDIVLRLTLRGETQDICKKDDKKTQEFKKLRANFSDLF